MVWALEVAATSGRAIYYDSNDEDAPSYFASDALKTNICANDAGEKWLQSDTPGWLQPMRDKYAMCNVRFVEQGGGTDADIYP